ncbi:MAG: PAS domain S-box protein [Goleter apudmare HA4340-LM2]|nr:PAS domain S-box protein [Goleter apudmare HA4340-LM2]
MRLNDPLIDLPNLHHVIDHSPLTISPDSYLVDAVALMSQGSMSLGLNDPNLQFNSHVGNQQGTSYILVVEETHLLGIITEKDIVRIIASDINLSQVKVVEVMTHQLVTLNQSQDIVTALLLLHQYGIRHLPVVDDHKQLVGIVTQASLLQAFDLVKIVGITVAVQQYLQSSSSELSEIQHSTAIPESQQLEQVRHQTYQQLNQQLEKQSTTLKQTCEELRATLEELQVAEEEVRQQNEELASAREMAELQRQRYQDLFEFAPDGYLVTDAIGVIKEANQAASTMLGVNQQYLVGKPLVVFIAQPERHSLMNQLHHWQQLQTREIYLQPRGGETFPVSIRVGAVKNSQGELIGWRWLLNDISDRIATQHQRQQAEETLRRAHDELEMRVAERTAELCYANARLQQEIAERQQMEAALRQSEKLYRDLVESQTELVIRFDAQGQTNFANLAVCQTLGLSIEELRRQSLFQFVHPDDLPKVVANMRALASSRHQQKSGERRIFTVSGLRWFEWNVTAILNGTEEVVEYQTVGRDISDRKQMEQALRESEEKFRHFAENIHAVIWINSPDSFRTLYVNPAYEKIWGRSCQSLLEQPDTWIETVHPEDRHLVLTTVERQLSRESSQVEYRILRPDGSIRWIWDRGFAIHNEQGEIYCYGGIAEDITERKQAEESLRRSEERLSLALEAAQMGIWDWNLLTNEAVWSPNMGLIYGLPNHSLCSDIEDFLNLIHPEDQQYLSQVIASSIEAGTEYALEFRVIWPDGSIHWLGGRGQIYCNELGQPLRMIGTTRDITDRKQAEQALRESEERYRSVVTAMREGVMLVDVDGVVVTCNGSAERILGLSADQMIGKGLWQHNWQSIHEDQSPFTCDAYPITVTLRTGEPCLNVVMGVYTPNGQLNWVSINSQPLFRDHELTPYAVVASFTDITEQQAARRDRKQAQQKIQEQAALLDIATDAICVRDLQTQISFWNKGAEHLYGWQQQEILGKKASQFLYQENSPQIATAMQTVLEQGSWHGELSKLRKSGQEVIVESRWTLVCDATGQPTSILAVDTDITEKKQLEQQFFRAQRLESLGTLAGGIAHDLNNILTPILAASQLLDLRYVQDKERYQQLLGIIGNNAKRGAALVKQVLSFARGFQGERTIVQLKHLITEITHIAKQTFPKSIEFSVAIPEHLNAVFGDATQLHQVLMNLVVNARDAMPEGGNIKIVAENKFIDEAYARMHIDAKVGNYIVIQIADTGIGMAPEVLDRIFEPFFTTKDVGAGTGLGLSTVLGIIKSHGGFVNVTSQVDRGSQFKLFLPAVEATQAPDVEDLELPTGNGEVILVVDDEAQIREITTIILEKHQYQTLTASNGIEAIALYAQHKYQIGAVLMDMMMPEMDGITAIRALQKMNPLVKVIASSGLSYHESCTQTSELAVPEILSKPYTANDLLNKLHQILR